MNIDYQYKINKYCSKFNNCIINNNINQIYLKKIINYSLKGGAIPNFIKTPNDDNINIQTDYNNLKKYLIIYFH
jgi:hypothetical protein